MIYAVIVAAWVACGVLACGMDVAWFQHEYPDPDHFLKDLAGSLGVCLASAPVALFVVFFSTGFARHGLMYWPKRTR